MAEQRVTGGREGRRALALGALISALVVIGGGVYWWTVGAVSNDTSATSTSRPSATLPDVTGLGADPATVELPAPQDPAAAKAWLEGDGHVAVVFVDTVPQLWQSGATDDGCAAPAEALQAVGAPQMVVDAASSTPDPPTAEMLTSLYNSAGSTLSSCADPGGYVTASQLLAWQWTVVNRQLVLLGVRQ
jgi:hypothetical protein